MSISPSSGLLLLAALLLAASSCTAQLAISGPITDQDLTSRLDSLNPEQRVVALQHLQKWYPALYARYTVASTAAAGVTAGTATVMTSQAGTRCGTGFHKCNGTCVNNNAVATCGKRCQPCPAPQSNGGTSCVNGKCRAACNKGYKLQRSNTTNTITCVPRSTTSSPSPTPSPSPAPVPCLPTQGLINGTCSNCTAGHPGDGFTCPIPPCSVENGTAVTEDGCKQCGFPGSNGWECLESRCPIGYGTTPQGTCRICPAGTRSSDERNLTLPAECVPCEPGSYQPLAGSGWCNSCLTPDRVRVMYEFPGAPYIELINGTTIGKMAPTAGSTACNVTCPNPAEISANGINCTSCDKMPGYGLEGGVCVLCGPGTYSTDNMTTCAKCPAGTSSNQFTDGQAALPAGTQLNWFCARCSPVFTIWPFSATLIDDVYGGGVAPVEGAASCTPCNATGTSGYSWKGLACNATCADIPGWGSGFKLDFAGRPTNESACVPCLSNFTNPGNGSNATCSLCTVFESQPVRPGSTKCSNDSSTGNCFPGHSRVLRLDAGPSAQPQEVALAEVRVGDSIQVVLNDGSLGYSKVFAMPHYQHSGTVKYFTLTTASGHTLQLSSSHYAYTAPAGSAHWSQRVAVAGKDIRPGHVLWVVDGQAGGLVQSAVTDVELRSEVGAFVVWTLEGHAVIDGTAPSSYSNSFGSDQAMHKVAQAAKLVYWAVGDNAARWLHESGTINWVAAVLKAAFRAHQVLAKNVLPELARVVLSPAASAV